MERPINLICKWVSWISVAASAVVMMVVTTDVLMRRLLDITIKGSFEISTSLLVVMVFCAVAWVMVVHGHVEVDVFTRRYPKSFQKPLSAIALFLSFIIVALMCWGSIILGLQQLKIGESSVLLKIPVAPFVFTVAVGSALLCLVILIQFIRVFIGGEER